MNSNAKAVFDLLRQQRFLLATAESCTGGMVAASITDIAGSSEIFDRGFVTYSNAAKQDMLSVPEELLRQFGAVSRETAEAMALGAIRHSLAGITISITGIAGPSGGSAEKPVGLVHFGLAFRTGRLAHEQQVFQAGDRHTIRQSACDFALGFLRSELESVR
jgi:nicotinamide-nucleotide amidase